MFKILDNLNKTYRIITALQIGLDEQIAPAMQGRYTFTQFFAPSSENHIKNFLEENFNSCGEPLAMTDYNTANPVTNDFGDLYEHDECCNDFLMYDFEKELYEYITYFQPVYDLVYFHCKNDITMEKNLIDYFMVKNCRHIILSPNVIYSPRNHNYIKSRIDEQGKTFTVYNRLFHV